MKPIGKPVWKIRFTPFEIGKYTFNITARNSKYSDSVSGSFNAILSNKSGFVRVCNEDKRFFKLDNGQNIFFVGMNLGWHTGANGTYDYERWFRKMRDNGINLARLWMASWSFAIEWKKLGYYDLENAWRLDWILNEAERSDIYIMLCLINHGQFSASVNPEWGNNPYNSRLGGPLRTPPEFFTNQEAISIFERRLRYILARWGYSTHLMAWEFWNEVDLTDNYEAEVVRKWHGEMSAWLRLNDPYRHLISTSFSNPYADEKMWDLETIDFSQVHMYNTPDFAQALPQYIKEFFKKHGKPVIVAEFSAEWRSPPVNIDPPRPKHP